MIFLANVIFIFSRCEIAGLVLSHNHSSETLLILLTITKAVFLKYGTQFSRTRTDHIDEAQNAFIPFGRSQTEFYIQLIPFKNLAKQREECRTDFFTLESHCATALYTIPSQRCSLITGKDSRNFFIPDLLHGKVLFIGTREERQCLKRLEQYVAFCSTI